MDSYEPLGPPSPSYLVVDVDGQPPELDPRMYMAHILAFPEHDAIATAGADIAWLFRYGEKKKNGRRILGMCYCAPKVMGDLSDLFEDMLSRRLGRIPDFLIVLDWAYWEEATPRQREILCHHEMCHASQALDMFGAPRFDRDGMPVWALKAHDIEEFNDTARRYGIHSGDIESFLQAITDNMEGA